MTYRFTARAAGVQIDPDEFGSETGLAEQADGKGFILLFQSGMEEPDEQEIALGFDTHCLVTANQGTAYGCVREVVLSGNTLHVSLDPEALVALGLEDAEIEAVIEAPDEDVAQFCEVLAQVLAYGRADALPTRVAL